MATVNATMIFRHHPVAPFEEVGCDPFGIGRHTIKGIVNLRLEFTASCFPQAVGGKHRRAVEKCTLTAEVWHTGKRQTHIPAEIGTPRRCEEIGSLSRDILTGVVALESGDVLKSGHHSHHEDSGVPNSPLRLPRPSTAGIAMDTPCSLRLILELKVNGRLIGEGDSGEHLHRLMILHHLHSPHILMVDTVGGNAIFTPEQVGALDIEFVDGLPLIFDFAVARHVDSRHTLQHVAYRAVLRLSESAHSIGDSVALLTYAVALHRHLFQQCRPRLHLHGEREG